MPRPASRNRWPTWRSNAKLLYAEDFVYFDGVKGLVELLIEAQKTGKGRVLYQRGVCAHQGSHAPAYDTPAKSGGGGGALFNKACHPLGPYLYLKQVEGILGVVRPLARVQTVRSTTTIIGDLYKRAWLLELYGSAQGIPHRQTKQGPTLPIQVNHAIPLHDLRLRTICASERIVLPTRA